MFNSTRSALRELKSTRCPPNYRPQNSPFTHRNGTQPTELDETNPSPHKQTDNETYSFIIKHRRTPQRTLSTHKNMQSFSLSLPGPLPTTTVPKRTTAVLNCTTSTSTSFSISDSDLTSRGFALHRTTSDLNLDSLNTIFARVGFPRRDPARIRLALEHTQAIIWIKDERSGEPVAFARATGDGVFNAVVWDVVVDPSFQGIGLGKVVMERLVGDLVEMGVTNIGLYAEPRVIGFYRPLGFAADPDGIKAMVYSTKKNKRR